MVKSSKTVRRGSSIINLMVSTIFRISYNKNCSIELAIFGKKYQ